MAHVAATWGPGGMKIYLNGILYTTNATTGASPEYAQELIAASAWADYYRGEIWNNARSEQEIESTLYDTLNTTYYVSADSGLIAYYRFDEIVTLTVGESQIDVFEDLSINENHAEVFDTVMIVESNAFSSLSENNTISLDGEDDYMEVFDSNSLDLDTVMTLEAWYYYQPGFSGEPGLVQKDGPSSYGRYGLWIWENEVDFCLYEDDGSQQCFYSGSLEENTWHHIAAVYNGDSMFTYIDGTKTGSISFSGKVSISDLSLFVGADPTEGLYLAGRIDELRIWNRPRLLKQIKATMNKSLPPAYYSSADSGLVAYFRFDTFEDLGVGSEGVNDIRDYSVYSNHGDVNGGALLVLNNIVVSVDDEKVFSEKSFNLRQNYPNPFNPITHISYSLKEKSRIKLAVYDVSGRKVKTLFNSQQNPGEHTLTFDASGLSSGVYIYKLTTASGVKLSRKMILLR